MTEYSRLVDNFIVNCINQVNSGMPRCALFIIKRDV